jgi:hypothetical protein
MSLDQNLFTLYIKRSEHEQHTVDLVDPQGTVHYRKRIYQPPASSPTKGSTGEGNSQPESPIKGVFEVFGV